VRHKRHICAGAAQRLSLYLITRPLAEKRRLCQALAARLRHNFRHNSAAHRQKLALAARLLHSLSYENILERGFALVFDAEGALIRRAQAVAPGQELRLRFADGALNAAAAATPATPPRPQAAAADTAAKPAQKPGKQPKSPPDQGNLF